MRTATRSQIEAAYLSLRGRGVDQIGDLSLGEVARTALGSPEHDPGRYSLPEIRLAQELLARTWLHLEEAKGRMAADAALEAIGLALGLDDDWRPSDLVAAVEQLVADDSP